MYSAKDIQNLPECMTNRSVRQQWRDRKYAGYYATYHIFWPASPSQQDIPVYGRGTDSWAAMLRHPMLRHPMYNDIIYNCNYADRTSIKRPLSRPQDIPVYCATDPVSALSALVHRYAALVCMEMKKEGKNTTANFLFRFCALSAGMIIQECGTDPADIQRWLLSAAEFITEPNKYNAIVRASICRRIGGYISELFGSDTDSMRRFLSCRDNADSIYRLLLIFFISGITNKWMFDDYYFKSAAADTGGRPAGYRCYDNTAGAYLGYFHLYAFSYDERGGMVKTLYNDFRCNMTTYAIVDILTWLLERELVSAGICQDSCNGSLLPPDRYNLFGSLH